MVASGQLTPGTELPSVRDVATQYTVNPTTISKAYSLLENEGLLQRNRGKPMTIAAGRPRAGSLSQRLKQVESQVDALVLAARQLELTPRNCVSSSTGRWRRPVTEALVSTHGLGKAIGAKSILRDISVEVSPGSIVGIIGKNGAGKTTLMDILLGFSPATAGTPDCSAMTASRCRPPSRAGSASCRSRMSWSTCSRAGSSWR